jgi:death-on-curing protein
MTRYLTVDDVLTLHGRLFEGTERPPVRLWGALEAAVEAPKASVDGRLRHPELPDQAAVLGYGLITGHPFVDGNKRAGHAAMEVFLALNGYEIGLSEETQAELIRRVADGRIDRRELADRLRRRLRPYPPPTDEEMVRQSLPRPEER